MKIKVVIEIDAPEGASHYFGNLLDEPTWLKGRHIAGYPHWFQYDAARKDWLLISHSRPYWAKEIEEEAVVVV